MLNFDDLGGETTHYYVQFMFQGRMGSPPKGAVSEDIKLLKIPHNAIGFTRIKKTNGVKVETRKYLLARPDNIVIGKENVRKKLKDTPLELLNGIEKGDFAAIMRNPRGPWVGLGGTKGRHDITIVDSVTIDELWPNPEAAVKPASAKKRASIPKHIPGVGTIQL